VSDKLRVAGMVDSFHASDGFPQPGVMKVDVFDQLRLGIRWSGDENRAGICNRFSYFTQIVGTRCRVPAADRVRLVMDVSGRIVRVKDECFDVGRAEMKYASFTMINPDHGMIVMFGHGIHPFLPVEKYDERRSEQMNSKRSRD
jgi:hypothetical protein